jgi:hypothetical protein
MYGEGLTTQPTVDFEQAWPASNRCEYYLKDVARRYVVLRAPLARTLFFYDDTMEQHYSEQVERQSMPSRASMSLMSCRALISASSPVVSPR